MFLPSDNAPTPYTPFLESLSLDYYTSSNHLQCREKNGESAYEIEFKWKPPEGGLALAELFRMKKSGGLVLDVGTGSGVIALGIASRGLASVVAVDILMSQCDIAIQNVVRNRLQDAVVVVLCDSASVFGCESFDAVISNPPQLPAIVPNADVRNFAGPTGFEAIDRIILQSKESLVRDGDLWLYALGFLGIDERTGRLPCLFERLQESGFKPCIVRKLHRKLTKRSKTRAALPLIRRLYPHSDIARNNPNVPGYEVYVVKASLQK